MGCTEGLTVLMGYRGRLLSAWHAGCTDGRLIAPQGATSPHVHTTRSHHTFTPHVHREQRAHDAEIEMTTHTRLGAASHPPTTEEMEVRDDDLSDDLSDGSSYE